MNGAHALIQHARRLRTSTSASRTRAPPRCTSSPRSTTSPGCGRCSGCSRASSPARPTATRAWPTSPPRRCSTSAPASATASPTCTTPARAHVPIVNLVGDHATYHHQYDAPLQSDIEALASNVSGWIRSATQARGRGRRRGRRSRSRPGARPAQVATLILPADVSWGEGADPVAPKPVPARHRVGDETVADVAKALRSGEPVVLLLGGAAMREDAAARREPHRDGNRGQGARRDVPDPRSTAARASRRSSGSATWPSSRSRSSQGTRHLVLVDAKAPVSFFAYPDKPSSLVPDGCEVHVARRRSRRRGRRARAARRGRRRRRHRARCSQLPSRPGPSDGPDHRRDDRRRGRRASCPKARSSPTRRRPVASGPRARPRARRATTGSRSPAGRSGSACRSRPAPRSRARTVR